MPKTKDQILDDILRREGGYINHPNDKGGPTKYGITLGTLQGTGVWGDLNGDGTVDIEDVKVLTIEQARELYSTKYVDPFKSHANYPALYELLIDSGVQHGVPRILGWLSEELTPDPMVLYKRLLQRRMKFYGEIITARPANAVFAKGWLARLSEFVR